MSLEHRWEGRSRRGFRRAAAGSSDGRTARPSPAGPGRGSGRRLGGGLMAVAALLPGAALAHPGTGAAGAGWPGALVHALTGPDHLVIMAAVGFAAASAGRRAGILLGAAAAALAGGLHAGVLQSPSALAAFLLATASVQAGGAALALVLGRLLAAPARRAGD